VVNWEIGKARKSCSRCNRKFESVIEIYSGIVQEGENFVRLDFCAACWENEKQEFFSYWKTSAHESAKGKKEEDIKALTNFFKALSKNYDDSNLKKAKIRYIIALFLLRKRQLKMVTTSRKGDNEYLTLEKSWDGENIEILAPLIGEEEFDSIKKELETLFDFEIQEEKKENIPISPE